MLSLFKDLGQTVQELCASHSLEGTETSEEGTAAMTAVVEKELKDLMEKQGLNIRMLTEQIKELKGTVATMTAEIGSMKKEVMELQERWSEFIEEEEAARQEYAKYFEEQEKYKQELRADRDRLLEKEHRMEGHLGPSRSEIDEFSDRPYFDAMTKEREAQESMEESENEYYTQSFEISEEEAGPQWQEEEEEEQPKEPEQKPGQTQEEYDAERKELLAKARADKAAKEAKRKEQEKGFKVPIDKSHDWKFYIDKEGNVWKQNYKTGEKIWWNYDYKYKHQKGKGKDAYEKAGKGHRPREPFKPRDEEDAKYWERMGKMEEEKLRKREEEKAAAEEKERKEKEARERLEKQSAEEEEKQKQKARETLEKAAEKNERQQQKKKKRQGKKAAAEEQKRRKEAAEERKKMEEEAEKRKEQEARKKKKRIEELEKELAELKGETRSKAGSTRGEEGKTEKQERPAAASTKDPETKSKGPPNPGAYMRGAPKFDEETDRNYYAVFPDDGNDYQWKWNQNSHFWYYLENRCWHKQESKDAKGKQVCLTQESRWLQAKGKKGKGKGKNKGKDEEEEDLARQSPEYDYIEAGRQEAEGGGSSSTDFQ
ncbi:Reticulocyte-binding protein 2-like a [Symbiodinium microadriaticum]|uniref:Reticulocyte-binding protein 2-like a n=1 Tax=Symbiodinium microadriaticum TaxID=2951 RepID=A0A1Q9CPE3_SYMMI|nr:Reticulocyte-binding protein 2-like a [Symbiodinium microadriaticum]